MAGCWLARRPYQLKASTTMDLGIGTRYLSAPDFCMTCGFEKFGLLVG